MTRGILDPAAYYYRRVFADGVRAVETVRAHDSVDPGGSVTGASRAASRSPSVT